MSKEKKIGLVLSIAMIVGSVVGIGIFFKNGSISKAVDGDGVSWLFAWIIGGLISMAAAVSFAEIGSFKNGKLQGLSNWVYKITKNPKLAYHNSLGYAFFYWGILNTVLGIFASEALFYFFVLSDVISYKSITIATHIFVGLVITVFFLALNIWSYQAAGKFQFIITIIKFLPLFAALFIGIIFPNTHNNNGSNAILKNAFTLKGIIAALPAVLFAYDAFLVSSSISEKTKSPTKTVPKAILFAMIFVVVLYSLIAISSILHSAGNVHGLLSDSLPGKWKDNITMVVIFFIFLSALGVTNGISSAFVNELSMNVQNHFIFGSKALLKKFTLAKTNIIYIVIIHAFYFLTILVPSLALNTDILMDAISNFPTLFFFVIYGLLIFKYTLKRKEYNETKKINNYLFYISSVLAIAGILFVELSYLVFQFQNLASDRTNPSGWGVFWDNKKGSLIKNYVPILLYAIMLIFFISFPWINFKLEQKIFKRNIIQDFAASKMTAVTE